MFYSQDQSWSSAALAKRGTLCHYLSILILLLFMVKSYCLCYPWYCKENVSLFCVCMSVFLSSFQNAHLRSIWTHNGEAQHDLFVCPFIRHLINRPKYFFHIQTLWIIVVLQLILKELVTVNPTDKEACDMWNRIC